MKPVSSHSVEALKQAELFALEILNPPSTEKISHSGTQDVVVVHDYHPFWWYYPRPCLQECCPSSSGNSRKKEDNTAFLLTLSGVVILATAYFLGSEIGDWLDANERKQILDDRKTLLKNETENPRVLEVLGLQEKMLDSLRSEAKRGVLMKTALIGSSVLVGAGALALGGAALIAGGLTGGAACGALIFRFGYSEADTSLKEDAMQLLKAAKA